MKAARASPIPIFTKSYIDLYFTPPRTKKIQFVVKVVHREVVVEVIVVLVVVVVIGQ